MARISSDTKVNCQQPKSDDPCCPDCGALECLCRPRFFAGQLLSEQDLNRLDQYIKNKNRLHNLHQHGWGVVNGLAVLCDPCGQLKVTQGYAIDPCGNDIVVCEESGVDICELIRKCKQTQTPDCQPFYQPPGTNCDDLEEEWILTVSYHEWASRGVTALRGNTCGTASCACGASSQSDCSCGSNSANKSTYQNAQTDALSSRKPRGASQQCEATVTCEGYRFSAYKKPEEDNKDDDDDRLFNFDSSFWEAFYCCSEPLMNTIPPMPDMRDNDDIVQFANEITRWCCQFRENLLNYFSSHANTSCEILDHLRAVNCPNINSPNTFAYDFIRSFLSLLAAWAEGLKNCFCLALLPKTPQATSDVRVPLASVRVRARDCRILSVCNWTQERKMMISWPAMSHWLGIIPIGDFIRDLLDRLCCNSLLDIFDNVLDDLPGRDPQGVANMTNFSSERSASSDAQTLNFSSAMHLASGSLASRVGLDLGSKVNSFSTLVENVMSRGGQPLELGAVLNSVSPRFKLPENNQKLSQVEAKNLPLLLMSEVMVKPVLGSVLGNKKAAERVAEFQESLGPDAGKEDASAQKKRKAQAASLNNIQQEMDTMRAQIKQQETQIQALLKKASD